jgi:hypothetical protein
MTQQVLQMAQERLVLVLQLGQTLQKMTHGNA